MKYRGIIQRGAYEGQQYVFLKAMWPGWAAVELTDVNGSRAWREVREECLEYEW